MRNDNDTKANVMHMYEQHKHERGTLETKKYGIFQT
jgi:hypothetical protein